MHDFKIFFTNLPIIIQVTNVFVFKNMLSHNLVILTKMKIVLPFKHDD